MSARRAARAAVIVVVGVLMGGGGSASAATHLRLDPGDTAFSGLTQVSNTASDRAILATNVGAFTCQETSLNADLSSHTNASGSVTGTLTALTFTSCADDGTPVNVGSCALHAGSPLPTVHLVGGVSAGTVSVSGIVERCSIQSSSSACYYAQTGTATGTFNNATSSIVFPSIVTTRATTTADGLAANLCGETNTFSTTLTDVVQTSTGKTLTVTAPPPPPPPTTPTAVRTDPASLLLGGTTTVKNTTADPAVFTAQSGVITCTQTFLDADLGANKSVTTSITGSLTSLTFTSCTDTILALNISSCRLHPVGAVPTVQLTAAAGNGVVQLAGVVERCATSATQACYYSLPTVAGTLTNASSSIAFVDVPYAPIATSTTDAVAAANCGTTGNLSFTLTHIVQSTNQTVTVTTS